MTQVEQLAQFVTDASYDALSETAREHLKIRILDSIACAIGSLGAEPVEWIRKHVETFGGGPHCTLIGGRRTAPDRATLFNGALVRYLDFNDSYLALDETCHPSDNLAPIVAAAEYADLSGQDLLTALAIAYQVQCRLSDVAPVRAKGFDHTTQGAYAVAAGVSRALSLDRVKTANAIAISGTAFNAVCHANRRPVSLEGACLPEYCGLLRKCDISRQARHHRPARDIRRQQGIQGFHRRPFRDQLAERGP